MTAVAKFEKQNNIEEHEFDDIMSQIFKSFLTNGMDKSVTYWGKKEELLSYFTQFLEKYLELQLFSSKKSKMNLINFIDKINMQKELLQLKRNEIGISEIQIAGKRLGKKSQSAFTLK